MTGWPLDVGDTVRVDLHTHTYFSPDSGARLEDIIAAVARRKLGAIAVTDHNLIDGALRLREIAPFPVIVGEEIMTTDGEIIGLFLEEHIPKLLSPEETVERIKAQGGLVYVPHPFDRVRGSHLRRETLERLVDRIDIIEVINSRVTLPADNRQADLFAKEHRLCRGAGSDAHLPAELGQAWVELAPFAGAAEFLAHLRAGRVGGRLSTPLVHFATRWEKMKTRLARGARG